MLDVNEFSIWIVIIAWIIFLGIMVWFITGEIKRAIWRRKMFMRLEQWSKKC